MRWEYSDGSLAEGGRMIITISRQAGTNGALIAQVVAERLGLRYYDKELVEEVACRLHADPKIVATFDEARPGAVHSIITEWRSSVNEMTYYRALRAALRRIGEEDNAVILGRGANFALRCLGCLHIRLVGPLELRASIYSNQHDVAEAQARREIRDVDQRRARFIRQQYHAHIDDPAHYDLVINLVAIGPETAADFIIHAAEERMARTLPVEPKATLPQHLDIMLRRKRPLRRGPQSGQQNEAA